jgi:hypothetical protein
LDAFSRKWVIAKSAKLLLEVFLNGLETSAMDIAHIDRCF